LQIHDVLEKRINILSKDVIIIGGGSNGCEVADFLLAGDNHVTIIEENDILAAGMEKKNRRDLMNRLEQGNLQKRTSSKVMEIKNGQVLISGKDGVIEILPADYVVLAIGFVPCNDLYFEAQKVHNNTFLIGDAFEVNGIKTALLQGQTIGEILK
jgi:pyruvate/2-oxoglutarate dehydrogenase complex dihydrolipoamide dehydrogenase (E3) component